MFSKGPYVKSFSQVSEKMVELEDMDPSRATSAHLTCALGIVQY